MSMSNWRESRLYRLLCRDNIKEFHITTSLDLPNQRTIHCDVERTKSNEMSKQEKELLETILTYYCKETGVYYKQGMNEVLAPFILMIRNGMPVYIAYTCFKELIHLCLRTMFEDDTFRPLQVFFSITNLLLKYLVPSISNLLQKNDISPELYSTSWFLTIYATKVSCIEVLCALWEIVIQENDPVFPCFIGVALLEMFKDDILQKEHHNVPLALNRISITSIEDLERIISRSRDFKNQLPKSISTKLRSYDIYNLKNIDSYAKALSKYSCFSIMPGEIMQLLYPESKTCGCGDSSDNNCDLCSHKFPIIVIDCRSVGEQKQGYFPNTEFISEDSFENLNSVKKLSAQFLSLKGVFHFALMGSESHKYDNSRQENRNILDWILKSFSELEFPYISVVQGGYKSCHEFAMHYKLNIKSHTPSSCTLCAISIKNLRKNIQIITQVHENNMERLEVPKSCVFECKKYEKYQKYDANRKTVKLNPIKNLYFFINCKEIIVTDRRKTILDQYNLKDLYKATIVQGSSKTMVFYFLSGKKKVTYSFLNKNYAKECLRQITLARNYLNPE